MHPSLDGDSTRSTNEKDRSFERSFLFRETLFRVALDKLISVVDLEKILYSKALRHLSINPTCGVIKFVPSALDRVGGVIDSLPKLGLKSSKHNRVL